MSPSDANTRTWQPFTRVAIISFIKNRKEEPCWQPRKSQPRRRDREAGRSLLRPSPRHRLRLLLRLCRRQPPLPALRCGGTGTVTTDIRNLRAGRQHTANSGDASSHSKGDSPPSNSGVLFQPLPLGPGSEKCKASGVRLLQPNSSAVGISLGNAVGITVPVNPSSLPHPLTRGWFRSLRPWWWPRWPFVHQGGCLGARTHISTDSPATAPSANTSSMHRNISIPRFRVFLPPPELALV